MDLQTVRDLNKRSRAIRAKLQTLREVSTAIPNRRLDGMPKGTPTTSRTESLAVKMTDLELELISLANETAEQAAALTNEILSYVDNPDAFTVLIRRYVDDLPFKRIAQQLNFSEAQVFYLHRRGVKEFNSRQK